MTRRTQAQMLYFVSLLLGASMLLGCSTTMVPFTHELRSQHSLTSDDVRQLQFYVSHEVTLRRDAHRNKRQIEGGLLKLYHGKQIEQVVLREATPGVATKITADNITVSFAEGSALTFSLRGSTPVLEQPLRIKKRRFAESPNPFPSDASGETSSKSASDSLFGAYFLHTRSDSGLVSFHGVMWEVDTGSHKAHLMIASEALEEVVETHEVLGGRTVSASRKNIPLIMF